LSDVPVVCLLPIITGWLLRMGYTELLFAGMWGGNLLRVLRLALEFAQTLGVVPPWGGAGGWRELPLSTGGVVPACGRH
ncbi:hypothetical protein AB6V46_17195, partial [Stenotrophomonas maltophilia]